MLPHNSHMLSRNILGAKTEGFLSGLVYNYIYYDDIILQGSQPVFILAYTPAWEVWHIYTHLEAGEYIYTYLSALHVVTTI